MYNTLKYITLSNLTHYDISNILNHINVKNNTTYIDHLWYDDVIPVGNPDAILDMDYIIHQLTNTKYFVITTKNNSTQFVWQYNDNMYSAISIND